MTEELSGYVLGSSGRHEVTRAQKAEKIIAVLEQHRPLTGATLLEVGTGAGFIAHALSRRVAAVESVDIVDDRQVTDGYRQTLVTDEALPFPDRTFDVIVTNHVLEHVGDAARHVSEMRRVLKDDGVIYLASPNKWWVTDPHYKLPFISWMPHRIADRYLRLLRKRTWDIRSVSLRELRALSHRNGLVVHDRLWPALAHPERYAANVPTPVMLVARRTPGWLSSALLHVVPTHLKLLTPTK